jgi:hypothetical protein
VRGASTTRSGITLFARIFFVTHSSAIAPVLSPDEVEEIDAGKKVIFIVNDEEAPPGDDA